MKTHWLLPGVTFVIAVGLAFVFILGTRDAAIGSSDLHQLRVGDVLPPAPGVDFTASSRTLVVFLNSSCQYCVDSVAFHKKVFERATLTATPTPVVVISAEPLESITRFARINGFRTTKVLSVAPDQLPVREVPTLVSVNNRRAISHIWVGHQSRIGESTILKSLDEL